MASDSSPSSKRPVRSYVIRSGRLTHAQQQAIDKYWADHVIDFQGRLIELGGHFPNPAPLTVEIGFGMGASLVQMAEQERHCNFIGIEVHRPGIGKVLQEIVARDLSNLKLICHDASEVMSDGFQDRTIDRLLILFPDPWPKKRHHKRRLIQPEFVELLHHKLKPGAILHLATDWEPYALHMMEVLENCSGLRNCNGSGQYWDRPQRPATKFEQRGKRLGHGVWDILFERAD